MPDGITSHAGLTMTLTELYVPDSRMMIASPLLMCTTDINVTMDTTDVLMNRTGAAAVTKIRVVTRWPAHCVVKMPTAKLC